MKMFFKIWKSYLFLLSLYRLNYLNIGKIMKKLGIILIGLLIQSFCLAQDTIEIDSVDEMGITEISIPATELDKKELKLAFLDSLNAIRKQHKFPVLQYNFELDRLVKIRTKTVIDHIDQIENDLFDSHYTKFISYKSVRDYKYFFNTSFFSDSVPLIIQEGNVVVPSYYKPDDVVSYAIHSMKENKSAWKEFYNKKYTHVTFDFRKGVRRIIISVIFSKKKTKEDLKKR